MTHQVMPMPPVSSQAVSSIAISIPSIEMKLIPNAVDSAFEKSIWPLINSTVSSATEVARPLISGKITRNQKKVVPIATSSGHCAHW